MKLFTVKVSKYYLVPKRLFARATRGSVICVDYVAVAYCYQAPFYIVSKSF